MNIDKVDKGRNWPSVVNVIIEIPAHSDPVKYEVDHETGAMFVDRFMTTAMHYPCNYGYVPNTLSSDGDPVDVLVIAPYPLIPGSVVRCRPIGVLVMADQAGDDPKVLAVPIPELSNEYNHIQTYADVSQNLLDRISHFFEHYKELDEGKWARVDGWEGIERAKKEIVDGVVTFDQNRVCT